MLVAHFADLHFGHKHTAWIADAFGAGITKAAALGCEAAVLAGDTFDDFIHLHHPAVAQVIRLVCQLADTMPVLILQGTYSHDRPGCLEVFRHLEAKHPIHVATATGMVALTLAGQWEPTAELLPNHRALFYTLPSLNPAEVRANDGTASVAAKVVEACEGWAPISRAAQSAGVPTILVSHGTVNGCVTESRNAMVSPDHEFTTGTLFASGASAIMLGHIHKEQEWTNAAGQRIGYSGSICTLVYGHDGTTGLKVWNVRPGEADTTIYPIPARKLIELDFDGRPDMAVIASRLGDMPGAYVRVRYQVDEEHRTTVDRKALEEMLTAAGAAEVKVEGRINPVIRSRAAGIVDTPSVADKLKRWCSLTNTPAEPLLQRLAMLQSGTHPGARA